MRETSYTVTNTGCQRAKQYTSIEELSSNHKHRLTCLLSELGANFGNARSWDDSGLANASLHTHPAAWRMREPIITNWRRTSLRDDCQPPQKTRLSTRPLSMSSFLPTCPHFADMHWQGQHRRCTRMSYCSPVLSDNQCPLGCGSTSTCQMRGQPSVRPPGPPASLPSRALPARTANCLPPACPPRSICPTSPINPRLQAPTTNQNSIPTMPALSSPGHLLELPRYHNSARLYPAAFPSRPSPTPLLTSPRAPQSTFSR